MDASGAQIRAMSIQATRLRQNFGRESVSRCPATTTSQIQNWVSKIDQFYTSGVWTIIWSRLKSITYDFNGFAVPVLCQTENVAEQVARIKDRVKKISQLGTTALRGCEEEIPQLARQLRLISIARKNALKKINQYPVELGSCQGGD
jgi:hypothetical protein